MNGCNATHWGNDINMSVCTCCTVFIHSQFYPRMYDDIRTRNYNLLLACQRRWKDTHAALKAGINTSDVYIYTFHRYRSVHMPMHAWWFCSHIAGNDHPLSSRNANSLQSECYWTLLASTGQHELSNAFWQEKKNGKKMDCYEASNALQHIHRIY